MKKLLSIIILALFLVALAACGADNGAYEDYAEEERYEEEQHENDYEPEAEPDPEPEPKPTQAFLADLDYMLYVLENNFALFDVAYWARGVDINALAQNARAEILAEPDMDEDGFFAALQRNFGPLVSIGHFGIVEPQSHYMLLQNPGYWRGFFSRDAMARLRAPHVLAFYEPRYDLPEDTHRLAQLFLANTGGILDQWEHILHLRGEYALAEEIWQAHDEGDGAVLVELMEQAAEIRDSNNVVTRIIEEGRIAHLHFGTFLNTPYGGSAIDEQILDFFEEIRDYEHLIIDLTGNPGGGVWNFLIYIMSPIIEHRLLTEGYIFWRAGDYATAYMEMITMALRPLGPTTRMNPRDREIRAAAQMLEEFDLPQFHEGDLDRLDYALRTIATVDPRRLARFDNQPAFSGRIWLLTNRRLGSAAQLAAWLAKEMGFATLVGETTGGVYGGPRTLVALPNSGIVFAIDMFYVTDSHGRPLEAGTIPHYFNREGMDALETVLAIIEEGHP